MKDTEFIERFKHAACFCLDFTQRHITEVLPKSMRFNFALNERSYVDQGQSVSFNGKDYKLNELVGLTPKEALAFIYVNGKVPHWIDLYVNAFNEVTLSIEVTFSVEFSDNEEELFNKAQGLPPFHIIGPTIPKGWRSLEEDGKFAFLPFT